MQVADTIKDRILKLFRMATHEGSNPHEAELAMTKMRQMMAEHDLAMADVERAAGRAERKQELHIVMVSAFTRKGLLARYDHAVALAVQDLTSTTAWLINTHTRNGKYQSMRFIGLPEDAELAAQLFNVFLRQARHYARAAYGPKWGVAHSSFVFGFGNRLRERAADWKGVVNPAHHQRYGLILVDKKTAIQSFMLRVFGKDSNENERSKKISLDMDALARGRNQADRTDLLVSKKIGA